MAKQLQIFPIDRLSTDCPLGKYQQSGGQVIKICAIANNNILFTKRVSGRQFVKERRKTVPLRCSEKTRKQCKDRGSARERECFFIKLLKTFLAFYHYVWIIKCLKIDNDFIKYMEFKSLIGKIYFLIIIAIKTSILTKTSFTVPTYY